MKKNMTKEQKRALLIIKNNRIPKKSNKPAQWLQHKSCQISLTKQESKTLNIKYAKATKKIGLADRLHRLETHKIQAWEKTNPNPRVERNLFAEEFYPKWQADREAKLVEIRDKISAKYRKLHIVAYSDYSAYGKDGPIYKINKKTLYTFTDKKNEVNSTTCNTNTSLNKKLNSYLEKEFKTNPSLNWVALEDDKGKKIIIRVAYCWQSDGHFHRGLAA